tara:strand:- start:3322 stop:3522 length:201 start_codon:yes stop_codon:yes gene_type:complete
MANEPTAQPQVRYRLNVQYSVKGVRSTDATMEMTGPWTEIDAHGFLGLQREFQAKVDTLYPPPPLA